MKKIIFSLFMFFALISCSKYQVSNDKTPLITIIKSHDDYTDAANGGLSGESDPFELKDFKVEGDSAFVTISYSGGCKQHSFEIIWSGMFSDTEPPVTGLVISHNANDDMCEAYITRVLEFNLKDLNENVSFDTVCINILNGWSPDDSVSYGGWSPEEYDVAFPEGEECVVEVTASRVICGAGLFGNLWLALDDSVSAGIENFYFKKYLQPVALDAGVQFVPVQGKKYKIGAMIQKEHPFNGAIICMAYSGPSVPVKITCVQEAISFSMVPDQTGKNLYRKP